jgi:hypothetical protein
MIASLLSRRVGKVVFNLVYSDSILAVDFTPFRIAESNAEKSSPTVRIGISDGSGGNNFHGEKIAVNGSRIDSKNEVVTFGDDSP